MSFFGRVLVGITPREFLRYVVTLLSTVSLGIALSVFIAALTSDEIKVFSKDDSYTDIQIAALEELAINLEAADRRLLGILEKLESSGEDSIDVAILRAKLNSNSEQIESLFEVLDIKTTDVISLVRLRDEVNDLAYEVVEQRSRLLGEIDRMYTVFFAIIGALLVAMVTMVLANFLSSREKRKK